MRRLLALAALMLAACGGGLAPVNMKDPAAVAKGFVAAYNARDLAHMLPLVDQVNLDAVKNALADGPSSEAYRSIFQPEMVDLLAKDGGKVEGPRYERSAAVFKVGDTMNGNVYTIEMTQKDNGAWLIDAFNMMSEPDFLDLPDQPKKR